MSIYSIYKVVNKVNGKVYIGFTSNFEVRKKNHKNDSSKNIPIFHKALKKYGMENFDWQIIYQSKEKEHTKKIMEQFFIERYNSMIPYGYNTCPGGGGGGFVSEKTIHRMNNDNPMKKMKVNSGSFKKGQKPIITLERNEKIRQSKLGQKNINFGKTGCFDHINKLKIKCSYCNIVTTKGNLSRWHNEKCKNKPK